MTRIALVPLVLLAVVRPALLDVLASEYPKEINKP